MYRLSLIALGVAALTVFSLGCGSSESGTNASATNSSSSAEVTKAQFIKQAEAICAKNERERETAIDAWEKEGSSSLKEGLVEIVAPALTEEAEALKALTPPAEQQVEVARILENLSNGSRKVEEGSPGPEITKFVREAEAFGLKTCAAL
jgi:hypothetical protein